MCQTTMLKLFLPNCDKIRFIQFFVITLKHSKVTKKKTTCYSYLENFYKSLTKLYNLIFSQTQETQKTNHK